MIITGNVSIHAPAWGATVADARPGSRRWTRFNPRARVGRDSNSNSLTYSLMSFQSTRPRGARLCVSFITVWAEGVSIHAPAWGATSFPLVHRARPRRFNPRARVGRDDALVLISDCWDVFQSTRPRGARLGSPLCALQFKAVSIHAPAWGATYEHYVVRVEISVSIHAPAWGATAIGDAVARLTGVSIHAPAWGATGSVARANGEIFVFQSTRPRGARRDKAKEIALRFGFQSTRPRGARLEISL